ncbi:MAG: hypothetical protein ACFFCW_21570 [Candidatus Hodarchaeota archaeon]
MALARYLPDPVALQPVSGSAPPQSWTTLAARTATMTTFTPSDGAQCRPPSSPQAPPTQRLTAAGLMAHAFRAISPGP